MQARTQQRNPVIRNSVAGLLLAAAAASTIFSHTPMWAQSEAVQPAGVAVSIPKLIRYSGTLVDGRGWPITTPVSVTFAIYVQPSGDDQPQLWQETQQIVPNSKGGYTALLGSVNPNGVPVEIFKPGESQYLSVKVEGEAEQPRVMLVSVPYALKAADAATLGGLPASAYALVGSKNLATAVTPAITPDLVTNVTTTGGTTGYIPEFSGASTIVDSPVFVSGANVGIGTSTPTQTLDINGPAAFRGNANFFWKGAAHASGGANSSSLTFSAETYDSSTASVIRPFFSLLAESAGNNTASPSATLNVQYSNGTTLAETGLHINANGTIHFAPGQTFPDTSATFPANSTDSAYFGSAGNSTSTGSDDTASGFHALSSNTTGSLDTAVGYSAGPDPGSTGLTNATAIGANATVSQSNSLVLGKTTAGSPGASHVNVGIGTAKPASALEVSVKASSALGPTLTLTNPGGATADTSTNAGTAESIDFNSYIPSSSPEGNLPAARIEAVDNGFYSDNLIFSSKFASGEFSFLQQNLTIQSNGQTAVGLPTSGTLPGLSALLTVFDTGPTGWDGIDAFGGAEVGAGISATGGDETASSSIQGGTGGNFVGGFSPGTTGDGIVASPGDASFSSGAGWAGLFFGDIDVTGTIFGGAKDFKIDHPLDPANKYLVHTSVESSEMMNIYTGNVVTDELGLATVKLPDWFEAENADFRYQLTVIGRKAQAWVAEEVSQGQFKIASDATNTKVSWQITAVRQDAYAKAHPLVVEQTKSVHERGFYEHPELYGQPANKQTEWGRNPQQMQRMKAMREQQKLKSPQHAAPQLTAPAIQPPTSGTQLKPISLVETK